MKVSLKPHAGPESIGPILKRWLSDTCPTRTATSEEIARRWEKVVGQETASFTRVSSFSAGVLTVEVASSPLLTELSTFRREELLQALRGIDDLSDVKVLRFRAAMIGNRHGF